MSLPIFTVDAFTSSPFRGNPAAVCLLDADRESEWMQRVAAEMNLSETAFIRPMEGGFSLRWFTPTVEVRLCGHATLASAHVLWEAGRLPLPEPARFHTLSGWLTARRCEGGIELDFPSCPAHAEPPPSELAGALGVQFAWAGRNGMDWLVEVGSEADLRGIRPDFVRLATLPVRGVIVTARSQRPEFDFVSRFFAPASGVNEDPVTGSAHCCLTPYWSAKLHKDVMVGYQASARGGVVRVHHRGDRVALVGQAVTMIRGQWCEGAVTSDRPP